MPEEEPYLNLFRLRRYGRIIPPFFTRNIWEGIYAAYFLPSVFVALGGWVYFLNYCLNQPFFWGAFLSRFKPPPPPPTPSIPFPFQSLE